LRGEPRGCISYDVHSLKRFLHLDSASRVNRKQRTTRLRKKQCWKGKEEYKRGRNNTKFCYDRVDLDWIFVEAGPS